MRIIVRNFETGNFRQALGLHLRSQARGAELGAVAPTGTQAVGYGTLPGDLQEQQPQLLQPWAPAAAGSAGSAAVSAAGAAAAAVLGVAAAARVAAGCVPATRPASAAAAGRGEPAAGGPAAAGPG